MVNYDWILNIWMPISVIGKSILFNYNLDEHLHICTLPIDWNSIFQKNYHMNDQSEWHCNAYEQWFKQEYKNGMLYWIVLLGKPLFFVIVSGTQNQCTFQFNMQQIDYIINNIMIKLLKRENSFNYYRMRELLS